MIAKRIKKVRKELDNVNSDIQVLSKPGGLSARRRSVMEKASGDDGRAASAPSHDTVSTRHEGGVGTIKEIGKKIHDKRFSDYLASSFQVVKPLRHERRIQRNKAILMAVLVLLLLFAVLYHLYLERFFL